MKIRSLIAALVVLFSIIPLLGQDYEKKEILKGMTFPNAEIKFGESLNDPLFAINIKRADIDHEKTKKTILEIEKGISNKTEPEMFFEIGNLYKDLNDFENSIKSYRKYLDLTSSTDLASLEDSRRIQVKGEIYYALYEIDLKKDKKENLEKALLFLTRSIELNPDNPVIYIKLGDCYLSAGKTTEALYCYNKAYGKNNKDAQINSRLQAASFQRDFLKLSAIKNKEIIEYQPVTSGFDFDYIETGINNSSEELKESLRLQHYIYLLRIMLFNSENTRTNPKYMQLEVKSGIMKDEEIILNEADKLLKSADRSNIDASKLLYLTGIVNYLKHNYKTAVSNFKSLIDTNAYPESVYDDIIFINLNVIKNEIEVKKNIEDAIRLNPEPVLFLILADIEFKKNNLSKSEMLCMQSLKISETFAEACSALAVIYAINGNYIAADEMIKKGSLVLRNDKTKKELYTQIKVNEAAVALLKNEKERAYILLRSVISVDNNDKALQLYNRYFIKK